MRAEAVFAGEAKGGVIDLAGHCAAGVAGVVEVGVEQHAGLFEVQVAVVLVPGVAQF